MRRAGESGRLIKGAIKHAIFLVKKILCERASGQGEVHSKILKVNFPVLDKSVEVQS